MGQEGKESERGMEQEKVSYETVRAETVEGSDSSGKGIMFPHKGKKRRILVPEKHESDRKQEKIKASDIYAETQEAQTIAKAFMLASDNQKNIIRLALDKYLQKDTSSFVKVTIESGKDSTTRMLFLNDGEIRRLNELLDMFSLWSAEQ